MFLKETYLLFIYVFGLNVCVHPWIHSAGEILAGTDPGEISIPAVTYIFSGISEVFFFFFTTNEKIGKHPKYNFFIIGDMN